MWTLPLGCRSLFLIMPRPFSDHMHIEGGRRLYFSFRTGPQCCAKEKQDQPPCGCTWFCRDILLSSLHREPPEGMDCLPIEGSIGGHKYRNYHLFSVAVCLFTRLEKYLLLPLPVCLFGSTQRLKMKIKHTFFTVLLWSFATNVLDALRQCNRYGDCGAVHYCLNSYCEPCIPCKDMFNRQPAQSVSGMAICAKHEDDCGGCLPGYQAEDLAQQRRTMHCFRLPEKGDALPASAVFATSITTILSALAIICIFGIYIKRKFAAQEKKRSGDLWLRPIPIHEMNTLIMDDLPTYDEAVNNLPLVSNSNVKKHASVTDGQDSNRELNAESDLLTKSSVVEADISTPVVSIDSVLNPLIEEALPINGMGYIHSDIESADSSNEEQLNDAGVLQPDRSSCYTIADKWIVNHQIASMSKISGLSVKNQTAYVMPQSPPTSLSLGPGNIENGIEIAPSTTNSTLEGYQHRHGSSEVMDEEILKRKNLDFLPAIDRSPFKRIVNWVLQTYPDKPDKHIHFRKPNWIHRVKVKDRMIRNL
ncbi:hypothetical protein OUZ56_025015 [Daphnia magna]|uniref:TNFR-Cys domain-containing protein n=1 Tax=Daphnia magna TaxID=35525 RepID=A0ABQ9ZIL4_9CRUS|nr:hypothetical protein OUZ56_025015 [Daphnia magna]